MHDDALTPHPVKPVKGQRVEVSNPNNSTLVPTPTLGRVIGFDTRPDHSTGHLVNGAVIEVWNPVPGGLAYVFVAESDFDEALTAVD